MFRDCKPIIGHKSLVDIDILYGIIYNIIFTSLSLLLDF